MEYNIRPALPKDEESIAALLPSLAGFKVPDNRNPDDLWQGDAKLLAQALAGTVVNSHVIVAEDPSGHAVGVSLYSIKPELLSGASSVHLEALAVHHAHMRQGLGKKLIEATQKAALSKGANCMSLHVFSNNTRARALYQQCGFDEELIRCYMPLTLQS